MSGMGNSESCLVASLYSMRLVEEAEGIMGEDWADEVRFIQSISSAEVSGRHSELLTEG